MTTVTKPKPGFLERARRSYRTFAFWASIVSVLCVGVIALTHHYYEPPALPAGTVQDSEF